MAPRPLPVPLRLPGAALVALWRRMQLEWRAATPHRLAIGLPRPSGLAIRPRDFRPADPGGGARLLRGEFGWGGEILETGVGGDPWRRPAPDGGFAAALHGFAWLPDLLTQGEAGAQAGLRLWLDWRRAYGRYDVLAWSGRVLERRVFNLACAAGALAPLVSDAEGAAYVDGLARQARHLLGEPDDRGRGAEQAAVAALVGAALAGAAGESLLRPALRRLAPRLARAVLPDGVHASRSPERGLELLFDLLALDDALSQIGAPAPAEVSRAIDRLAAGVRFFALGDGRLPSFHGGEGADRIEVATALALDAGAGEVARSMPYGAFQRLDGGALQLIADAGSPPAGAWRGSACAQPAAIAVVCETRRLIIGSAWSDKASVSGELRGPAGGSCVGVDGAWPSARLLAGLLAGGGPARLDGGPADVRAERSESGPKTWLDIAHDGWLELGLGATRRLYLDAQSGELRGEDVLTPTGGPLLAPVPFAIRFILAPDVAAQVAIDGRSVLLRPAGAHGWRLRCDAAAMRLERGAVFDEGAARATQVLVLPGVVRPGAAIRVRWKLSRDDG
jgi:uncharacterized heparinase superfamily protein